MAITKLSGYRLAINDAKERAIIDLVSDQLAKRIINLGFDVEIVSCEIRHDISTLSDNILLIVKDSSNTKHCIQVNVT